MNFFCRQCLVLCALLLFGSPARAQASATALDAFVSAVALENVDGAAGMLAADPRLIQEASQADRPVLYEAVTARTAGGARRQAMVALLLSEGADPNRSGRRLVLTPLIAAEQNGEAAIVGLLLKHGADPNQADLRGMTPLAHALADGRKGIALRLIAGGLDFRARDLRGWTPLHVAARSPQTDTEIMQALLGQDSDVNIRTGSARSPYARADWPFGSLDSRGLTPLHIAAASGRTDLMRLLIAHGADIEARTDDGNTPLHEAARSLSPALAALLAAGADPSARNRVGDLPLHLALRASSPADTNAALGELIAHSDLTARDQFGLTPLLIALVRRNVAAETALRGRGDPSPTVLAFDAAARDDVPALNVGLARQPYLVTARLSSGWTLLHMAALWGAADTAGGLLAKGADVNAVAAQGETPLGLALTGGESCPALIPLLIRAGADINRADDAAPPLLQAAARGDETLVALLLARKANPNARGARGDSPLLAAIPSHPAIAARLLAAGADVNAADSEGGTPLDRAEKSGSREIAGLLRHAGAVNAPSAPAPSANLAPFLLAESGDVLRLAAALDQDPSLIHSVDDNGDTLLHKAFWNNYASPHGLWETVRLLMMRGAEVNARNRDGQTPLHLAAANGSPDCKFAAVALLRHGAEVGLRDRNGQTPLHRAATTALAALLIAAGGSVHARDSRGDTPLHCAAAAHAAVVSPLLAAGANANARNDDGEIPLHLALRHAGYAVPPPLVKISALTLPDRYGMTPLERLLGPDLPRLAASRGLTLDDTLAVFQAACVNDVPRLAHLLIVKPALLYARLPNGQTPLHLAAIGRSRGTVLLLLEKGADINTRDARAVTPLLAALSVSDDPSGVRAMAALLLARGADANLVSGRGETALHQAFRTADPALIRLLLAHRADANARDAQGNTPLHLCVSQPDVRPLLPSLAQVLLTEGADLNAWGGAGSSGDDGPTPLEAALSAGREGLADYFVAQGANINAPGASGETPLALANRLGNVKMAAYLRAHGAR